MTIENRNPTLSPAEKDKSEDYAANYEAVTYELGLIVDALGIVIKTGEKDGIDPTEGASWILGKIFERLGVLVDKLPFIDDLAKQIQGVRQ